MPAIPTDQVLGPLGALVLALAVVGGLLRLVQLLWREHLNADADDREQRDLAERLLELSLQNNRDSVAAWNKRIEQDAARRRRADRP